MPIIIISDHSLSFMTLKLLVYRLKNYLKIQGVQLKNFQ